MPGPCRADVRILLLSNHPKAPTGYGRAAGLIGPALRAHGHDVAYLATDHRIRYEDDYLGDPVFSASRGTFGFDIIGRYMREWEGDVLVSLHDLWTSEPGRIEEREWAWVPWFPIDSEPVMPAVAARLPHADARACFTAWGAAQCAALGFETAHVPLPLHPAFTPEASEPAAVELDIPAGAFLFGNVSAMVSGHISRKSHPQIIMAFARMAERHDDAYLYMHCPPRSTDGHDYLALVRHLGIEDRVIFVDSDDYNIGSFSVEDMADLYRRFDCMVLPSASEGFGYPLLEAQACGTPVIASGWMGMPELAWSGAMISPDRSEPVWMVSNATWRVPHVAAIHDAMEKAYAQGRRRVPAGLSGVIRERFTPLKLAGDLLDVVEAATMTDHIRTVPSGPVR